MDVKLMEAEDIYVEDGTTDFRNEPAIKKETGTWKACPYILGNECCERLAYYGINTNLVKYLKFQLNQRNVVAVNNVTNWSGTCYVTPLLGAFLADAHLGRYWTIASFSIIHVIVSLLILSFSFRVLKPPCDNNINVCHPTRLQTAVFSVALYLIALGTGGIKPCVSSLGADQFDDSDAAEKKKNSFFNWFYFSIHIGALIAASVLVWIQSNNVGWGWGFGIPAALMAIAVGSFFSGTRLCRNQRPGGSPLTRIRQVVFASLRKFRVQVPTDKSCLYETVDEESTVEGRKRLDHTEQLCTFIDLFAGLPLDIVHDLAIGSDIYIYMVGDSASLSIFDTISFIFWVSRLQPFHRPLARKYTGHKNGFTQLQRIAIGHVISVFAMLAAGTLDLVRLRQVRKHDYYDLKHVPMLVFWQVPRYFIIGCAEVFTFIGQLELFYEQAPDAMIRSLCSALSLSTAALGNYASTMLVNFVMEVSTRDGGSGWIPDNLDYGHLHYFFWLLAVLSVLITLGIYHKRLLRALPWSWP
ncbi:protein NRT1/ PTR FAMILY 8.1-like [Carya illinoinensis]|uniref:protein NRT1/ PTR FAMILY 8.1-like n=1 Tax=Carya illinoinensis TaxID=32201 RepID=UPI001C728FEE|nr:protein NRT1/ PTR FAMILY 8.1-like [Carya illinoinensis]